MDAADLKKYSGKERSLWAKSFSRLLRNKIAVISGIFIIVLVLVAVFADYLTPYTFAEQDLINNNAVPEWMIFLLPEGGENYAKIDNSYPLAADSLGRDIWTRTIFGARISLIIVFSAATVDLIVGILIGMISFVLGIILAVPFTYLLSTIVSDAVFATPIAVVFTPVGYLIWLGLVIILSSLASVLPARNAARLTIREVLAYE